MIVDLISTTTSDGVRLDGVFLAPDPGLSSGSAIDGVLLIHGSGTSFCSPHVLSMAEDLRVAGYPCLNLNTRGHDIIWRSNEDGRIHGNAFEILDDSRADLRAGLDYLAGLGYRRLGIVGHSMGAVKVAYYAATEKDERVKTVIPVSPVRLSYSYYMHSPDSAEFQDIVTSCDQAVAEGEEDRLIKVGFPIPHIFGASAYLDKHGPEERYNLVPLAPNIMVPMLVLGGSLETHTRILDMAKDLAQAATNSPQAEYLIVEGGEHSLMNLPKEASGAVLDWLARVPATSSSVAA